MPSWPFQITVWGFWFGACAPTEMAVRPTSMPLLCECSLWLVGTVWLWAYRHERPQLLRKRTPCHWNTCHEKLSSKEGYVTHNSQSVRVTRRGFSPPQVQRPITSRGLKGLQGLSRKRHLPHIPLKLDLTPAAYRTAPLDLVTTNTEHTLALFTFLFTQSTQQLPLERVVPHLAVLHAPNAHVIT